MSDITRLCDFTLTSDERLQILREMGMPEYEPTEFVNNHIHTTYSFSPYTPSGAVYMAKKAGLTTCGIVDHDSISGAEEFIEAGKILDIPTTIGFELRLSMKGTPFEGRHLNNPDQTSIAYFAMHSIPHQSIGTVEKFLAPLRAKRNERNVKQVAKINELFAPYGISIDFEKDVIPLSMYKVGGSVTERHILFALVKKVADGKTREDVNTLINELVGLDEKTANKLLSAPDNFYLYDILGVFKSKLIKKIYVPADEELVHATDFVKLAKETGAIAAYAYLGDVAESPTGDKAAQKFEDDFVEELFEYLHSIGVTAITYMPSRNTPEQLERVMKLCDKYGFFQISGEDVNSPRQSFTCPAMLNYPHLFEATYALIGNEIYSADSLDKAIFSDGMKDKFASLGDRIAFYANIGRNSNK